MGFQVYFTSKHDDNGVVVSAVQVFEDLTKFEPVIRETERADGATFLEDELEAFLLAMKVIKAEEFDDVTLYNQNRLIFNWIMKNVHDNKLRESYCLKIRGIMEELYVEQGVKIKSGVVPGNKNEAKKPLKEYMKNREVSLMDMTSMFGDVEPKKKEKKEDTGTYGRVINLNNRRVN